MISSCGPIGSSYPVSHVDNHKVTGTSRKTPLLSGESAPFCNALTLWYHLCYARYPLTHISKTLYHATCKVHICSLRYTPTVNRSVSRETCSRSLNGQDFNSLSVLLARSTDLVNVAQPCFWEYSHAQPVIGMLPASFILEWRILSISSAWNESPNHRELSFHYLSSIVILLTLAYQTITCLLTFTSTSLGQASMRTILIFVYWKNENSATAGVVSPNGLSLKWKCMKVLKQAAWASFFLFTQPHNKHQLLSYNLSFRFANCKTIVRKQDENVDLEH